MTFADYTPVEHKAPNGTVDPGRFSARFFDRFSSDDLAGIRSRLDQVVEDRRRQLGLFGGEPGLPEPTPAAPAPAPKPALGDNGELATVLSPTQLKAWRDCPAHWYYRYVLGLPEWSSGAFVLGRAVHAAIEQNWRQKIVSGEDLELAHVDECYRLAWEIETADQAIVWGDEPAESVYNVGRGLVAHYMTYGARAVQPAKVETHVEGAIGGVRVQGYIDLLDTSGRVIDLKTKRSRPSAIETDFRSQIATYRKLCPEASGEAQLAVLTKTQKPALHRMEYTVSDADLRMIGVLYPLAQEGMRAGLYFPNREAKRCSRRMCSFWEKCQSEYGGEVKP